MNQLSRAALVALLVALALCASLLQARSFDMWWHLETGEQILATHHVPDVDDFSFTSAGQPWVNHEWLFQALLYASYAALGAWGLLLLKAACALFVALVLLRALRPAGAGPAVAIIAVCLIGMRFRLAERPEIATLPLAALTAALMLDLAGHARRPGFRLALPAAIAAVWANVHAGALLAPLMGLAVTAGALAEAAAGRRRGPRLAPHPGSLAGWAGAGLASGLCVVAVCLNPAGVRIYEVPYRIAQALAPANMVNPEWLPPAWSDFPLYHAAAAILLGVGLLQATRRDPGALPRLLLGALVAVLAWRSLRHIGIFFAVAPLCLTRATLARLAAGAKSRLWIAAPVAAIAWMLALPPAGTHVGVGIQPDRFPVKAADFIESRLPGARLYNDVAFGGYLIWRGYPQRRVFIDGRNEVHADLLLRLSRSLDDGRRWQALLSDHDLDGAVVGYRPETIPVRDARTGEVSTGTFAELHFPRSDWALVHWDDLAMIYVRRRGRYGQVARELEYATARPEAWKLGLEGEEGLLPASGDPIVQDLRRKLQEDPDCRLAKRLMAVYR